MIFFLCDGRRFGDLFAQDNRFDLLFSMSVGQKEKEMDPDGRGEESNECSEKQYGSIAERFDEKSGGAAVEKRTLKDNEILEKCKEGEDSRQDEQEDDARVEVTREESDREVECGPGSQR